MIDESAEAIIELNGSLKSGRAHWDSVWQDIADYVMPRKSQIATTKTPDVVGYTDNLYDNEATHANGVLAAGQMDYLLSGRWFEFEPPTKDAPDAVKRWYKQCSEITLDVFNASNFHLETHEFCLDRGGFGTAHLHMEEDEEDVFSFSNAEVGTFSAQENHKGLVDTVFREIKLTARQAAQKFGEEALGEKVGKCYRSSNPKEKTQEFEFIHAVFPRDPKAVKAGQGRGEVKPIASVYVCVEDKNIVRRSGYDEMPCFVSRYLKWGKSPYGYCPSIEVLPTVRQLNFIEKNMDALAELTAFPRFLIPSNMEGDVDLRAAGVTIFDENNPNAIPKEWGTVGRYDVGKDRAEQKRDAIRRAYHVDLFQLLTSMDEMRREKTAFEVHAMLQEKLSRISPTFERLKVEVFGPILRRAFSICFRRGLYPAVPEQVLTRTPTGEYAIDLPRINYVSKLAMAIKAGENQSFVQWWSMTQPMIEMDPTVLDELNTGRAFRKLGENQGVAAAFWNTDEEKQAIKDARAEQQQAAAMAEMAPAIGKAAKDLSGASPEVQKALSGAARN